MVKSKQLSIIANLQIVFWLSFVLLSVYSLSQSITLLHSIERLLLVLPIQLFLFYAAYLWLIPYFFEQKKYLHFYSLLALILLMATALRLIIKTYFSDWLEGSKISLSYQAHLMIILVSELIIVLIGSLLSVAKQKYEYEKKYQESKRQFLQSELNYLRAQISPHFLLNSLNNIYCFAVASSPQTPAAVLKLSEMLKYFLYESSAAKIAVSREMEIIQSYIGLFILKFEVAPDISLTFSIKDEHKQIEPLLLMGLVENAFKHSGIGIQPNAYIHITAEEKGNQFIFTTTNSVLQVNETVGAQGGIGLQNIARRVKLNYPGNHEMNVSEWDHSFSVQLVIPFI